MVNITIKKFTNGKGRVVEYLCIDDGSKFPASIGIKKALKVIEHGEEIKKYIATLAPETINQHLYANSGTNGKNGKHGPEPLEVAPGEPIDAQKN